MSDQIQAEVVRLRMVADALEDSLAHPQGPRAGYATVVEAGKACVRLCGGDKDQARTLWKLIMAGLGGYMPNAAAVALIRASNTENLVPDVEAPVPE